MLIPMSKSTEHKRQILASFNVLAILSVVACGSPWSSYSVGQMALRSARKTKVALDGIGLVVKLVPLMFNL